MKIAISFTGLLRAVFENKINLNELGMIFVGCSAEHLPDPAGDWLPMEVSWMRKPGDARTAQYDDHLVRKSMLGPEQVEAYTKLYKRMQEIPVFRVNSYWDTAWHYLNSGNAEAVYLSGCWWTKDELNAELGDRVPEPMPDLKAIKFLGADVHA